MSLERVQQLLRTYFIPAVFIFVAVIFFSWLFLFREKPAEEKWGKLPDVELESVLWDLVKINNNTKALSISRAPNTLHVYFKGETINIKRLVQKLGFTDTPTTQQKISTWQKGDFALEIYTDTLEFTYSTSDEEIKTGGLTEQEAIEKGRAFLRKLGLDGKLFELEFRESSRLQTDLVPHPQEAESDKDFKIYSLIFDLKLNGYDLVSENGIQSTISMNIDRSGKVRRLQSNVQLFNITDKSTYTINKIDILKKDLERGLGTVVHIEEGFPTRVERVDVAYTGAKIDYVLISRDKYIRPYYFVEWFVRANKFGQSKVRTILPAIELGD